MVKTILFVRILYLSSIVISGQTGMKCRKNRKNVKLRYTDDIYMTSILKSLGYLPLTP